MHERIESGLLGDQREFISLNATLMYASKRTYPTVHFGDQKSLGGLATSH